MEALKFSPVAGTTKWTEATLAIEGELFRIEMARDQEPNETYGIAGGRIVKLFIFNNRVDLLWYDREWCKLPNEKNKAVQEIYTYIINLYN